MSGMRGSLVGVLIAVALGVGAVGAQTAWAGNTVLAWGENNEGQLGNGTTTNSPVPVPVCEVGGPGTYPCKSAYSNTLRNAEAIAAGGVHGLALVNKGEVVAWGGNTEGQLGDGTTGSSLVPVHVCAPETSCSSTTGPFLTDVKEIAAAGDHSMALLDDDEVVEWGRNCNPGIWCGVLGNNSTHQNSNVPVYVCVQEDTESANQPCPSTPLSSKRLTGVKAIAAGGNSSLALLQNDDVVAWGNGETGLLGNDMKTNDEGLNSRVPVYVCAPKSPAPAPCPSYLEEVEAIAVGGYQAVALKEGWVVDWGSNGYGQLGDHETTTSYVPQYVCKLGYVGPTGTCPSTERLEGITAVTAGSTHGYDSSFALGGGGHVLAWGSNEENKLGTDGNGGSTPVPYWVCEVEYSGGPPCYAWLHEVVSLSHQARLAVLGSNHEVAAWGANTWGQLGDNNTPATPEVPVYVCELEWATGACPNNHLEGVLSTAAGGPSLALAELGQWLSEGKPIPAGKKVKVKTKGELTFKKFVVEEFEVLCKLTDEEVIENLVSGGAGIDEITKLKFTGCHYRGKGQTTNKGTAKVRVGTGHPLPWKTKLVCPPPVADEITGIEIEIEIKVGTHITKETYTGNLRPELGNSVLTFTTATGELTKQTTPMSPVIGFDNLTGPKKDTKITADC